MGVSISQMGHPSGAQIAEGLSETQSDEPPAYTVPPKSAKAGAFKGGGNGPANGESYWRRRWPGKWPYRP